MSDDGAAKLPSLSQPRILLGITGSVAAVKGPELAVRLVKELDAKVRIVLTRGGYNFWTKAETYHPEYWRQFQCLEMSAVNPKRQEQEQQQQQQERNDHNDDEENLPEEQQPNIQVHYAEDEWVDWKQLGDSILHIDLRDWADVMVIAPLSAHTLAKVAHGLCDDTLSCVTRAWDFGQYHGGNDPLDDDDAQHLAGGHLRRHRPGKPVVLAPAMNTAMYQHPLTASQLETIRQFWKAPITMNGVGETDGSSEGVYVVAPQVKQLACGEIGNGALASVDEILSVVKSALEQHSRRP